MSILVSEVPVCTASAHRPPYGWPVAHRGENVLGGTDASVDAFFVPVFATLPLK